MLKMAINANTQISSIEPQEDFKVSLTLRSFNICYKLTLLPPALIGDTANHYENRISFNLTIEIFDNGSIKDNLLDKLLICSSFASDLGVLI